MGVTITTVGSGIDSNHNRRLDRDPRNGRLWTVRHASGTAAFWYSDNDGATWAAATGSLADAIGAPLLFVDLDGGLNVAYAISTGGPAYRRGIVAGTTIAWSNAVGLSQEVTLLADIVAFRNPTGGWFAAIAGRKGSGDENYPQVAFARVNATPDFAGNTAFFGGIQVVTPDHATAGPGFGGGLDFHHTGDGKTVQGGTPHLYVSCKMQSSQTAVIARIPWTGNGYGFSSFGWGTGAATNAAGHWYPIIFDGTRIVFLAFDSTGDAVTLYDRDAGNTATLVRATSPVVAGLSHLPEMSYDREGNIHVVILSEADSDLWYNKWTRATNTWGSWTLEQAATATAVRLRRGWHVGPTGFPTIEGVYTDATNLIYQEVQVVNAIPNAPGVLAPADGSVADVSASLGVIWQFNDPDQGDAQTAYTVRRRIGAGAFNYWNGSAWVASESGATKIVSGVTSLGLASGWGADGDADHFYSVKTWDALDQLSPWSAERRVIPSAKDNPTITVPASDGTDITTAFFNASWTVATQTRYRLRVVGDTGSEPNLAVVDYDSGIVINAGARLDQVQFPVNNQSRYIELTTWNDEGLQSTIVYRRVDVVYTPPAVARLTLNADDLIPGAIVVTIDNPGSGAAENSNDLYRRESAVGGPGIRIATGVDVDGGITDYAVASGVDYEYLARTFAASGAISESGWEDGL